MADEFLDLPGLYQEIGLTIGADLNVDAVHQRYLDAANEQILCLLGLSALSASYKIRRTIDLYQFATYIPLGKMIQSVDVITLNGSAQTLTDWYAQDSLIQREDGGEFSGRMVVEYTAGFTAPVPGSLSSATSMLQQAIRQAAAVSVTGAVKREKTSRHEIEFDVSSASASTSIPESVLDLLACYMDNGASLTL